MRNSAPVHCRSGSLGGTARELRGAGPVNPNLGPGLAGGLFADVLMGS